MSAVEQDMNQLTNAFDVHELLTEDSFAGRHIGPRESEIRQMLDLIGVRSLDELISETVPAEIRWTQKHNEFAPLSENGLLDYMRGLAKKNKLYRNFIGQGYYSTVTPPVIQRNILENPGWYTQYTPYQAEIAQGRLEALVNFQTMVMDLTGMELANASMLDEGTAAAEAMTMCARLKGNELKNSFFIAEDLHPQTKDVLITRAEPLGITIVVGDPLTFTFDNSFFGAVVQYPNTYGEVVDYRSVASQLHALEAMLVVATDLLALTLLTPPGSWGADITVGNSQRFGVPLGFGGPHAAFFATKDEFKRDIPGRLVGVSKDVSGKSAYRLALQTREQHIRRDKATSNICTAQVLLAIMAGMYAVYHGPEGLRKIARRVHLLTSLLSATLQKRGLKLRTKQYFDTISVEVTDVAAVVQRAADAKINLRIFKGMNLIGISADETTSIDDIRTIIAVLSGTTAGELSLHQLAPTGGLALDSTFVRSDEILQHPVFSSYRSETEFQRYVRRLESRDLSLTTSMIPLGSCTMKLNAAAEMLPITWPEFAGIHPFAPSDQTEGWRELILALEQELAELTGFAGVSVQPNAGSQGEYAGLLVIQAWHKANNGSHRNICLIPTSAHGTNPASAVMAGMEVVTVQCDESGNINVEDLKEKAERYAEDLSTLMVTYPSTHGVFEESIRTICALVHQYGGQVYMDGANLNAQVGLTGPAAIGADVCHINLHKTFCIPHGGGGPGVGPIAVAKHLVPYLPGHPVISVGGAQAIGAVSAAPWGSALILPISLSYIWMMGSKGLEQATKIAILNANYIAKRLDPYFPVLYRGTHGRVAHECILDLRNLKRTIGIEAQDVAKRLMDFGFHAPTVSFPVIETLMVEPTESESKVELDRFCDAMIAIKAEIDDIANGKIPVAESPLRLAPHTAQVVMSDTWDRSYSREQAAYPAAWLREHKYWPPVSRIDNVYGDRNLFCSCLPIENLE